MSPKLPNKVRVLFVLYKIGDVEILGPVIRKAVAEPRLKVTICVRRKLWQGAEPLCTHAREHGAAIIRNRQTGFAFLRAWGLRNYDVLLTGTESSIPSHTLGHRLTERANQLGLQTATIQQGLENVGLTYFDEKHDTSVRFASKTIYIWGAREHLPKETPAETRRKCLPVGFPKPLYRESPTDEDVISVFENLHWHRYNDAYRKGFFADLAKLAEHFPDKRFVLKPHPKGLWALKHPCPCHLPANLVVAGQPGGEAPACALTSRDLICRSRKVISTPSTVALDAALLDKDVAIYGGRIDVGYYRDLEILRTADDWIRFVSGEDFTQQSRRFRERVTIGGDAAERIVSSLLQSREPAPVPQARLRGLPKESAPVSQPHM